MGKPTAPLTHFLPPTLAAVDTISLVGVTDIRIVYLMMGGPGRTAERQYIERNLNVITTRAGRLRSEEPEIEPELVTTVQ